MKEKGFILALDQGTTSTRAILYNKGGEAIREARREIPHIRRRRRVVRPTIG